MAKAIKFYTGNDTYGRGVDVAQRVDGVWFFRAEKETQWGVQMSKWKVYQEPTWETHYTNEYDGKRYKYDEPEMAWGFNTLKKLDYKGARLPNTNIGEEIL